MKKFLSVFLVLAMFAAMIPIVSVTVAAEDTTPTDTWTSNSSYYDLSWCKTLDAADSNKTVTVDDKHYYVKGDWTNQTYHFTTAAQLAGLAYLSNATSGDLFKGDTFYIDADIDLGAHLWVPISKTSKFCGSLIGNVDGGSATISNMIINTSNETSNVSTGLVGQFGGGWIKNLDLVGAKITAKKFTVGSFVGWQNGNVDSGLPNAQGGYQNLTSDAQIVLTSGNSGNQYDDVGGIVGIINGCTTANAGTMIDNCAFTGTISAPYGANVGGIIGLSQHQGYGVKISDCVVISEKIEWGRNNYGLTQDWNAGLGGIAGNLYANGDANDTTAYTVKNCYVAANLITLPCDVSGKQVINVGGITGASCSQNKTYENCQFDGIISGEARNIGGILGRYLTPATIRNSVVSGVALRAEGTLSTFVGGNKNDNLSVTDCYASVKMLDGAGGTAVEQITATTDFSALLALTDDEGNNVWTKEDGDLYPVLAIAKPYLANTDLSVAKSGMDFSFCNFGNSMKICSEAQLKAFDALRTQTTFAGKFDGKVRFAPSLAAVDLKAYSDGVKTLVKDALDVAETTDTAESVLNTSKSFCQVAVQANASGNYDVRFALLIKGTDYSGVTMELGAERTEGGELKFGGFQKSETITKCYEGVLEVTDSGNVTHLASEAVGEGWYYVVFVATNVDLSYDTTFTLRATAIAADGTVINSVPVVFTVNANN